MAVMYFPSVVHDYEAADEFIKETKDERLEL